jgi:hypothetical protein
MSQVTCTHGSQTSAKIVAGITSAAVLQCSDDLTEAMCISASCAAPPVMILAGLMSSKFQLDPNDGHPATCADANGILFAALLLARMASPRANGVSIEMTPDMFKDALADFGKLSPLVKPETFIRADILAHVNGTFDQPADSNVVALFSGIMSKRPDTGTSAN